MESQFQKIVRKTGRKPVSCKCEKYKSQCRTSVGLGTPEDIRKLIEAGFADRLKPTAWIAGMVMKVTDKPVDMIQPVFDEERGCCTFFKDGLCELHDLGLKPTECRLSHHTITKENYVHSRSLSWNVAKTWLDDK